MNENEPVAKKRTAFTLIELLMVIAIMGMLARLLLPGMTRAQTITCVNDARRLNVAWTLCGGD